MRYLKASCTLKCIGLIVDVLYNRNSKLIGQVNDYRSVYRYATVGLTGGLVPRSPHDI